MSVKGHYTVENLQKNDVFNSTLILPMIMCIQNLVKVCPVILKILSKNQFMTSIKGRNSVADLQKKSFYNPNINLVNDNLYTKFG